MRNFTAREVLLVLTAIMLLACYGIYRILTSANQPSAPQTPQNNNAVINISASDGITDVPVNALMDFDGKTKAEVFKIRDGFVQTSIFKSKDYKPSEEVFGQIEDKKPWYGSACDPNYAKDISAGDSFVSVYINNPSALVMLARPFNFAGKACAVETLLIPAKISYDKKENLIEVRYEYNTDYETFERTFFGDASWPGVILQLTGLNARDFGYNWVIVDGKTSTVRHVTCDLSKGSLNSNSCKYSDFLNEPYEFKDFIHSGGSCGLPGGCNNTSPMQQELQFALGWRLSNVMNLKLWRARPKSKNAPADMNVKITVDQAGAEKERIL